MHHPEAGAERHGHRSGDAECILHLAGVTFQQLSGRHGGDESARRTQNLGLGIRSHRIKDTYLRTIEQAFFVELVSLPVESGRLLDQVAPSRERILTRGRSEK